MSKGPGIYNDIGKKARGLLYDDYPEQPPIQYHNRCFDWSFDVSCKINDIVPGLRTAFKFVLPFHNKVELQYLHDFVGITAGANLTASPRLNFSGAIGSSFFSIGTDLSFDVLTRKFSKCNAGLSFGSAILLASLALHDKGDTLRASCYHTANPLTNTAIAAELTHKFLSNETTLTFGTQHAPLPITLVKARVSSNGKLGALIQQEMLPWFFLTIGGNVDVRDVMRSAQLGLSLEIRP